MRYFNISGNTLVKLGAMTVMTAILAACSEGPKEEFIPVTLTGQVSMQAGPTPTGTVHFRLYNLWWLEGDLRHPLAPAHGWFLRAPKTAAPPAAGCDSKTR